MLAKQLNQSSFYAVEFFCIAHSVWDNPPPLPRVKTAHEASLEDFCHFHLVTKNGHDETAHWWDWQHVALGAHQRQPSTFKHNINNIYKQTWPRSSDWAQKLSRKVFTEVSCSSTGLEVCLQPQLPPPGGLQIECSFKPLRWLHFSKSGATSMFYTVYGFC